MIYPIESKSDLTGAMLVIRFPEEDLDTKALYTIQADQPDYLIPFRYRCVDGEAECTYLLENRVKLLFHCSSRNPGELTGFWEKVLQPLLDCGDWFLKPFSFVLDVQYLYTDREGTAVSYIYVPSKRDCGDIEALRKMTIDLAQKNPSTDAALEVKVLRAIMQDFQPQSFLQMLRKNQPAILAQSISQTPVPPRAEPVKSEPEESSQQPVAQKEAESIASHEDGDIQINLSGSKPPKRKGLFGNKEEKKKEKKEKKREKKKEGGLFGKKKDKDMPKEKEIVLGAAAEPAISKQVKSSYASVVTEAPGMPENDVTSIPGDVYFRLVGDQHLPGQIFVSIEPGDVFTIGRFDVTLGRPQSSFEFDAKTKAISRHHAAIERAMDGGYTVTDLNSMAGTFVDGERLTPNVPRTLTQGSRVSFGTAGADYIWEE